MFSNNWQFLKIYQGKIPLSYKEANKKMWIEFNYTSNYLEFKQKINDYWEIHLVLKHWR